MPAAARRFHKPQTSFEVLNDVNSNLTNLYRCVREQPEELKKQLEYVVNSREDFERIASLHKNGRSTCAGELFPLHDKSCKRKHDNSQPPFSPKANWEANRQRGLPADCDRAVKFYQLIRGSYANNLRCFSSKPHSYWADFPLIDMAAERLQRVIIENKDFEQLIRQYDRRGTRAGVRCLMHFVQAATSVL